MGNRGQSAEGRESQGVEGVGGEGEAEKTMTLENYKFREVNIEDGAKIPIRGVDGRIVDARLYKLNREKQVKVETALRVIDSRLKESNLFELTKEQFEFAARFAGFLRTRSGAVPVAYCSLDSSKPLIVLADRCVIWEDEPELAVTLLHELVHLLITLEDTPRSESAKVSNSKVEAVHDIACYDALGWDIPGDHWAFQKYPELLKEKRR